MIRFAFAILVTLIQTTQPNAREVTTFPFVVPTGMEIEQAFNDSAKHHAVAFCNVVFPGFAKRCSRATLTFSDVADVVTQTSPNQSLRLAATIDIARWARKCGIPPLPDLDNGPPIWFEDLTDTDVRAPAGLFTQGELGAGKRLTPIHTQEPAPDDPAAAKIAILKAMLADDPAAIRRTHPDQEMYDQLMRAEPPSISPRIRTRRKAQPSPNQDETLTGMPWID